MQFYLVWPTERSSGVDQNNDRTNASSQISGCRISYVFPLWLYFLIKVQVLSLKYPPKIPTNSCLSNMTRSYSVHGMHVAVQSSPVQSSSIRLNTSPVPGLTKVLTLQQQISIGLPVKTSIIIAHERLTDEM